MQLTNDQINLLETELSELSKVRDQISTNLRQTQERLSGTLAMLKIIQTLLDENRPKPELKQIPDNCSQEPKPKE